MRVLEQKQGHVDANLVRLAYPKIPSDFCDTSVGLSQVCVRERRSMLLLYNGLIMRHTDDPQPIAMDDSIAHDEIFGEAKMFFWDVCVDRLTSDEMGQAEGPLYIKDPGEAQAVNTRIRTGEKELARGPSSEGPITQYQVRLEHDMLVVRRMKPNENMPFGKSSIFRFSTVVPPCFL